MREHFAHLSPDGFVQNLENYAPKALEAMKQRTEANSAAAQQIILFRPQPAPIALDAYLAAALTGLNDEGRKTVFDISDVISSICEQHGICLYEPRKKTDPRHHKAVRDTEVFQIDREKVLGSDLVIHLCHFASTGAGEELDFAYSALVPLILVAHTESRVSRMITGIPSFKLKLTYTDPEELRSQMHDCLMQIRPLLEQRKIAFTNYNVNVVGDRIRSLREELGFTREDVAQTVPLLTVETLRQIEESIDRLSNPSLLQLRQIATVLKTTVADLVEPDLNERLVVFLEEWVTQKSETRFGGITRKDRNRLLRRMLLRIIDSLEDEDD